MNINIRQNKSSFNEQKTLKVVRCPICKRKIVDIYTGSKPFRTSEENIYLALQCGRCGENVGVTLGNV